MAITPTVVGPGKTHHISITDDDGTETGYILWAQDDKFAPRLVISREPALAPQQFQGSASYTDQLPTQDLVWEIPSFHEGGLLARWTPQDTRRYNQCTYIDPSIPGEFSLNNAGATVYAFLNHSDFDSNTLTPAWVASGGAVINVGSATLTTTGATIKQTIATANSVFASVTLGAIANVTITGGGCDIAVGYDVDGDVTTYVTTTSLGAGSFTLNSSIALPAGAHTIKFLVKHTATDTTSVSVTNTAITSANYAASCHGFVDYKGTLYGCWGWIVGQYDATNKYFTPVLVGPGVITGLAVSPTDDVLVAGVGDYTQTAGSFLPEVPQYTTTYYTTTDGSTWTSRTGPGGPYVACRNRLWGVKNANTISSSIDVTTPTWTDYTDLGTNARKIFNVFAVNDVLVVGKEDGMWVYNRADFFEDATPEFGYTAHPDNFRRGITWAGWLYLRTRRGVLRYNGSEIQDVGADFTGPQISDFSGRCKVFAIDDTQGYVLMDTPNTDVSLTKDSWLLSFEDTGQNLRLHTLHQHTDGADLQAAATFYSLVSETATSGAGTSLFVSGRIYMGTSPAGLGSVICYGTHVHTHQLTARQVAPTRDLAPNLSATGSLITPYWDGGFPDSIKTGIKLTFRTDGTLGASQTVTVSYEIDEDSSYTTLGSAVTTVGLQSLYFSTAALAKRKFKRIRFKFALATNSATAGPIVIMPVVLHTVFRPTRLKHYEFFVIVADNLPLVGGGTDDALGADLLTALDGYLDDTWPSTLKEDEDNDGTATSHTIFVDDVARYKLIALNDDREPVWVYRVVASQKVTS